MEQSFASQFLQGRSIEYAQHSSAVSGVTVDSVNFQSLSFVVDIESVTAKAELVIQHADEDVDASFEDINFDRDGIHYRTDFDTTTGGEPTKGIFQMGYIGKKRYVRFRIKSGTLTAGVAHMLTHTERVPTVGEAATTQFPYANPYTP